MFAAHIRKNTFGETDVVQSVREHCIGVADLASEFCSDFGASSIIKCAALLHDIGKINTDFNDYIHGLNCIKRGEIDHCFAGAKFIINFAEEFDERNHCNTANLIAKLVISHHGLHDWVTENCEDYLKQRTGKENRYDEILKNTQMLFSKKSFAQIFEKATEEYENIRSKIYELSERNKKTFCFYMGMLERLLQSALVDADRIDTAEFMVGKRIRLSYDLKDVMDKMYDNIEDKVKKFRCMTDNISVSRMDISDRCAGFAKEKRGICSLVVPTGGGKTLSSLRFAIHYCKRFGMKKIIYIAPYMSILEQNADVIRKVVEDESMFLEYHSNFAGRINNVEEMSEYEIRTDLWDSPILATTMVQFLDTLFSDSMTCVRRMHNLSKSVIIIDEIQTIPIKCLNLFKLAVRFLEKICGCTIVLCSATQPDWKEGKYGIKFESEESMTGDYSTDFEKFKRNEIISALRDEQYSFEEAADFSCDKFRENGNLLLIVNTKKAAFEIYENIKKRDVMYMDQRAEIIHLSTSMCPKHRNDMLCNIRRLLKACKPVICVTTQLIEAGVDVSFNCVVRSLAGLDSIAQAAGRCNRNGENECSPVYVINIKDENLSKLKQIREAGDITRHIMQVFPNRFSDTDIMSEYFRNLYRTFSDSTSYNVEINGVKTDIIELLSLNRVFNSPMNLVVGVDKAQAFATAGSRFEVISNNTINVIVPYEDEARYIIERLNCDIEYIEQKELLRKAQKYTVSIYQNSARNLYSINGLYELNTKGIYAVEDSFYDMYVGLKSESVQQEFLCF